MVRNTTKFPDVLLEEKFENVDKSFTNLHNAVHDRYDETDKKLDQIIVQTTATNGKVRKIIIALVLGFGLIVGLGFQEIAPVLALVLAA